MIFMRIANGKEIYLNPQNGREFWISKGKRKNYCPHGRFPFVCREDVCAGSVYCKHNIRRARCVPCNGKSRCKAHGKLKRHCRECKGGKKSFCSKHNKDITLCAECGGSALCIHEVKSTHCMFCEPDSKYLCRRKCGQILSTVRLRSESKICAMCEREDERCARIEHIWHEKLKEWGFHPSVHDKVIKDSTCSVTNRRRADFVFITESTFPYHIVVECDENSHGGYLVSCEMGRLEEIHDQVIGNTEDVKPIVIIRFNPFARNDPGFELREALIFLFKGTYEANDIRGVNLYKLIGYGRSRERMYNESKLTYQITDISQVMHET